MPGDFFGADWDGLSLHDVRGFLAEAEDEGLTWEAKGTERPHPGSVRKHVCGFANSIGGFYLVGAEREGREWNANGLFFGEGVEPTTWLGNVVRNGIRPVPRYDVKAWETEAGHVAVVGVDPIPDPPCLTSGGEVFERVSGETVRVIDPLVLRRLYERGEAAEKASEASAIPAVERESSTWPPCAIVQIRAARWTPTPT